MFHALQRSGSADPVGPGLEAAAWLPADAEILSRLPGIVVARLAGQRGAQLWLSPAAPRSLAQAVQHCMQVRERAGGFAGLVVFRASDEPGVYTIHTPLSGCASRAVLEAWPLSRRLELFVRVARSVQGLHELGEHVQVLAPEHVLLNVGGAPHVLGPGVVAPGTEAYQAPEVRRGDAGVDVRSDVYCLGALLYFLLVGEAPELPECGEPALPMEDVQPLGLRRIVRRACHPRRGQRYATVYDLLQDVVQYADVKRVGIAHLVDRRPLADRSGPVPLGSVTSRLEQAPDAAE